MEEKSAKLNLVTPDKDYTVADYEDLIGKISSVLSAKVVINDAGEIVECHILADLSRNVKQIVRDVQSALMARFNINLSYKTISIAQIKSEQLPDPYREMRLRIKQLSMVFTEKDVESTVTVTMDGKEYEGSAAGGGTRQMRINAVAQATLDAVNAILKTNYYELVDISQIVMGARDVYMVCIRTLEPRDDDMLTGSVVIRSDDYMAVVKAVLDAINRQFTTIVERFK